MILARRGGAGGAARAIIMTGMVTRDVLASPRPPILTRRPTTIGLSTFINTLSAHPFMVGAPIARVADRRPRKPSLKFPSHRLTKNRRSPIDVKVLVTIRVQKRNNCYE